MSDLIGKTLGRYQVIEELGQGGMAEVYKGYQPLLDRYVAIKVLHSFMLADPVNQDRFQREARSVANLRHPNIVQVFDFDTADKTYFMVMEYIDGPTLKAVMTEGAQEGRLLPLPRISEIITAVGNALGYAHSRGMIHRDIKPHNIMFTSAGQPMLADFGIAKILNTTSISDPNTISGTPAYMSPEQAKGDVLDARTDLYSLGIVLFELLTGRVPFDADSPIAVVYKHLDAPVPPPQTFVDGLPANLERVMLKALEKKPDNRYQTADEMVTAVQSAIVTAVRAGTVLIPRAPAAPPPRPATGMGTPPPASATPGAGTPLPARAAGADGTPPIRARSTAMGIPLDPAAQDAANAAQNGPSSAAPSEPSLPVLTPADAPVNWRSRGDSVTVNLAQALITAEAGGSPVENTALLSNPRQEQNQEQYNLEVTNLDPSWYELDTKGVVLFRGDTSRVKITFTIPRRNTAPGDYVYNVVATAARNPEITSHAVGKLVVSSPPTLQMLLDPPSATGATARYTIDLHNGPAGAVIVQLEVRDPSGVLEFTVQPDRVRLGPGEGTQMTLDVGVRAGAVGEPRTYPFTVLAKVTGGDEGVLPIEARAEFVHVPPVRLDLHVEMEPIHDKQGDYRVVLTNPTSLTLDVTLEASDPEAELNFFLDEETGHLQIARETTVTTEGIVRLRHGTPPEARTFPFTIGAHAHNVDGPGELVTSIDGELVYEPPAVVNPLAHVRMELAPTEASGDPAQFTIQLQNSGPDMVVAILRARNPERLLECVCEPSALELPPGETRQSSLSVRPAQGAAPEADARVPFEVLCGVPGGDPEHSLTCQGAYRAAPPMPVFEAFLIDISPEGIEGTYDVRLVNGGQVAFNVILRGRDTSGLLTFKFAAPRVTMAPATEKTVRLTVQPNALEPLSEAHAYPFDVICWIPSTNEVRTLAGKIVYVSF